MNLAIDVGNTFIKAGIFQNGQLTSSQSLKKEDLEAFASQTEPRNLIISSVEKEPERIGKFFSKADSVLYLNHTTPVPLKNLYKTPATLGMDRVAASVGAAALFPASDRLVIDAGTCITYEFIDREDQYHGGSISPGITIRFKALNTFTEKLPLVERNKNAGLIGATTQECILSGVQNGVISEVNGIIERYKEAYPQIKVIICGGDASFFESKIKETIFAVPELVLVGLNRILEYNVSEV